MDEKGKAKILWDFDFQIDKVLEHRRLEIVTFRRDKQECLIIDVAVPGDRHIIMKEREKVDKYGDLRNEMVKLQQLRESSIKVIPIVTGVLDSKYPTI